MNALVDDSNKKPPKWDEIVDDKPIAGRRMKWDERDGSKQAAWGGIVFYFLMLAVIAALHWWPEYP